MFLKKEANKRFSCLLGFFFKIFVFAKVCMATLYLKRYVVLEINLKFT